MAFNGIGKKTVWDVWKSVPNLTALFSHLSQAPTEITDGDLEETGRRICGSTIQPTQKLLQ